MTALKRKFATLKQRRKKLIQQRRACLQHTRKVADRRLGSGFAHGMPPLAGPARLRRRTRIAHMMKCFGLACTQEFVA
jgi:hypothetical protein